MRSFGRKRARRVEIQPDEILIDSSNLADFDTDRFEGRLEKPFSRRTYIFAGSALVLMLVGFGARAGELQLVQGEAFATQALENQLTQEVIFADRGLISDRNGVLLAWNERTSPEDDFAQRVYAATRGIAHVVGYARAPAKDAAGVYFRDTFEGIEGVERIFNEQLAGRNGTTLSERNARGEVVSEAQTRPPVAGEALELSIDSALSEALYDAVAHRAEESHFEGGAGVLIDVHTGEILALVSYPEFSSAAMTAGSSTAMQAFLNDPRQLFLNRATSGLYTPGSIVKPFMVVAALTEGVIDEYKKILSTGSIRVPNPYNPDAPSIFRDWRANGWTDAREAIAASSDIYFYAVGGGLPTNVASQAGVESQQGLGIARIDDYLKRFGFGADAGLFGFQNAVGNIPTPEWKEKVFDGDPWRLGDTYNTSIGQYGTQVTPLQAARAVAALANGGTLLTPTVLKTASPRAAQHIEADPRALQVAREGMEMAAQGGTAAAVNVPYTDVAGKTGTAQVGTRNQFMNSWVVGFFPYEAPRYAFAVVLEKAPAGTPVGSPAAMREFLDWMHQNAPSYLE